VFAFFFFLYCDNGFGRRHCGGVAGGFGALIILDKRLLNSQ
jgi:hypothetical protein